MKLYSVAGDYDEAKPVYITAENVEDAAEIFVEALIERRLGIPIADFFGLERLNVTRVAADTDMLRSGVIRLESLTSIPLSEIDVWRDYVDETNMPGML